ncbi:MAG: hypothetical protein SP4CHLAM5_10710 [Chlamydiia bacterium]|nr:hypothetical protein [Chlamydiia bacterium]
MIKPALLTGVFSVLFAVLYVTGCFEYFKWSVWREIHADIKDFVSMNMALSIVLAAVFYLIALLTFLPGLLLFDLLIGYMFPQWIGMLIIMTTAVVGAMIIVSGCRFGFKKFFLKGDSKMLQKVQKGFSENETLYLLFLRFVPFFPFAFVSAALSSLPVSYKKIAWTTFLGMLPVAFVLTGVGHGVGDLMKMDTMPSFSQIVSPAMLGAIVSLCVLSVLPIFLKKFLKKKSSEN